MGRPGLSHLRQGSTEDFGNFYHTDRSSGDMKGYHSDGDIQGHDEKQKYLNNVQNQKHYFEFKVLEAALDNICTLLDNETKELEEIAYPAIDGLSSKVTASKLEQVRQVKTMLTRLISRVKRLNEEIEHLLDNDDEMNEMYLTRKLVAESGEEEGAGSQWPLRKTGSNSKHLKRQLAMPDAFPDDIFQRYDVEELEDLLESYGERVAGTFTRLHALSEYIDDTEDFINILQDSHRNKLIQLDLVMTSLTFSVTLLACVASVFGMNVPSGLEDNHWAFSEILYGSLASCFSVFVIFLVYSRYNSLI